MVKQTKCKGSGMIIKFKLNSTYRAVCPKCDRTLKAKHAGGGYEGYANYWYLPTHKLETSHGD